MKEFEMSNEDDFGGFDDVDFGESVGVVEMETEPQIEVDSIPEPQHEEPPKQEMTLTEPPVEEPQAATQEIDTVSTPPEVTQEVPPSPEGESTDDSQLKLKKTRKSKAAAKKGGKKAFKPLSKKEKSIRKMLRRAGLDEEGGVPELEQLMQGKQGKRLRIRDIAIFLDEVEDEVLNEFSKKCPIRNRVNLSAEVELAQVESVGAKILGAGRMYQPIQVGVISEDGVLECTSGRHRLIFLAMLYGAERTIPVYVEDMTLSQARDAVVVANEGRKTKALEQAEHTVVQAIGGNLEAEQDEVYAKTVKNKSSVKKYCVYSVFHRGRPLEFGFPVSSTSSRKDGSLTTLKALEAYWGSALDWNKNMKREEFDEKLKGSIEFLNALAVEFQKDGAFEDDQHMATMTLNAIGKYYRERQSMVGDAMSLVPKIASSIVAMGEIGRQKHDETYEALASVMK
jgi:hypothetical protein